MNYRFLKLANLLEISQLIKVAVSKDNEKLREDFLTKFPGESTEKVFFIADQWHKLFDWYRGVEEPDLYDGWEDLETLDAVFSYIEGYIKHLEYLADTKVRWGLATSPSTSPDVFMKLSEDKESSIRGAVARNPSTPPDVLRKLSGDKDKSVRGAVARNTSTPPDALVKLSEDEDFGVRLALAENPSTPPDALRKLSGDESSRVRWAVNNNPSIPRDVVEKLLEDPDKSVRFNAKEALKKLQEKQASTNQRRFNKIARYLRISNLKN